MKIYKFVMNYSSGLDYVRTSCVTGKNFVTCVCSVCDSFTLFFIKTFSMDFKASKIWLTQVMCLFRFQLFKLKKVRCRTILEIFQLDDKSQGTNL